jgi:two-component system, chemotaxis family, CheB/CheR fusion protein
MARNKKSQAQSLAIPNTVTPAAGEFGDTGFPIVGIGASAGGLAAFEAFFTAMPTDVDPGMAFVLVQHLAPDHKSMLADLIRRYTRMQVFEVTDGMPVKPNCAYIIPPNHDMAALNGVLQLLEPSLPRGHRMPIDFFFSSLAADQLDRAIGIILSGTGRDGTLGLRAIKDAGGMVMVQNVKSSEFDGMPRSAIATGMVDYALPPAEMPAALIAYVRQAAKQPGLAMKPAHLTDNVLQKIFAMLRSQTGHDFSQYKPSTVLRRIERRMAVQYVDEIDGYIKFLQQTPDEVDALFRDLLIGVTSFFRDSQAFRVLEDQIIPQIFAGKSTTSGVVRVWVSGCSTGEEAYSIAILLQERMGALKTTHLVQVFATDIDSRAIAVARAGLYPASIAADITPERLARFFTLEAGGQAYRIHRGIRDMLVFSEHDLIKDPPFSKLDLISCRNLMIYFNAALQKKLLPLFHFALNPRGILFLGTSEGLGESSELFSTLDRKAKLYQRTEGHVTQGSPVSRYLPTVTAPDVASPRAAKNAFPAKLSLRELTEQALLRHIAAAGVLVDDQGDILYLHGRSGMYLELSTGPADNNILKMARDGLRQALSAALRNASTTQGSVRVRDLLVKTNGDFTRVELSVHPVSAGATGAEEAPAIRLYLVVLEEAPVLEALPAASTRDTDNSPKTLELDADVRIAALQQELRTKDEYLHAMQEQLKSTNEELKSSNEEMQSINEELQSTNEELETSTEELQSVNEELSTVNNELSVKVSDLSLINNDMKNLLAGSGIATIFVDHQLRIMRYTPTMVQLINLIPTDVGRPVAHVVSNLVGYDRLVEDAQAVLDTLAPRNVQVQIKKGPWFTMRIMPYRTLENVIEGVVITFVDITELKRIEDDLEKANRLARLAVVVRDANDAITVQDMTGHIIAWNAAAVRMYGWSEAEALQMNVRDRIPLELRQDALTKLQQLSNAEDLEPYVTQRITRTGARIEVWITATILLDEKAQPYAIATTERFGRPVPDQTQRDNP